MADKMSAMCKTAIVLTISALFLTGCNKSTPAKSGDAVQQKLQELAGSGATDCGRVKAQDPNQMKTAADCATGAAEKKRPFYVAYDLPGMTVAVAGNSEGKLFAVQSQQAEGAAPGATAEVNSGPCPAELRVAQSGRVTCTAPGSMGAPGHGGMSMPPAGGGAPGMASPHGGGMSAPAAGTPNPHATPTEKPKGKKP
jgi:hypothetical protein